MDKEWLAQQGRNIKGFLKKTNLNAYKIGLILWDVKSRMRDKEYNEWLKNTLNWSYPTAWKYIRIAIVFRDVPFLLGKVDLSSAIALSSPNCLIKSLIRIAKSDKSFFDKAMTDELIKQDKKAKLLQKNQELNDSNYIQDIKNIKLTLLKHSQTNRIHVHTLEELEVRFLNDPAYKNTKTIHFWFLFNRDEIEFLSNHNVVNVNDIVYKNDYTNNRLLMDLEQDLERDLKEINFIKIDNLMVDLVEN